jgi:RTX calcium-binding nonapeptide repeat (4 copies)
VLAGAFISGAASQTSPARPTLRLDVLPSSTATEIHNEAHLVVTTVGVGTTVHDFVTVTGQPGGPVPTGNVNIDWFLNGTCVGSRAASSGSIGPLSPSGQFDGVGFAFTVNSAGFRGFMAHYEGDASYGPSDGACESLRVVDANIQITPNGVNRVGQPHTFMGHVNVNDGTGFVNAPDGTQISYTIDSGPGGFITTNPCTTSGGTGSCQISLQSAVTGVTTVSAHTNVTVAGLSLQRDTNGLSGNSGPATKTWVNARIAIAPNATNEVGQPHTFTATLEKDTGTGVFVPAAGENMTITLVPANGATPVPPGPFNCSTNAAGQCSVSFTSAAAGTVRGHAVSILSVNGSPLFAVVTNGLPPNSSDAVKTFVDANIQITPQVATNPVGSNHTLTGHVNVNAGSGFVNAPDGTVISFSLLNASGATATFVGANSCATAGGTGSCTVIINSPTTGTTTTKAMATLSVGGVSVHRETGDGLPGDSPDANKTWVGSAAIVIAPNATNEVGQNHTFTATLLLDTGSGLVPVGAGESVTVTLTAANGANPVPAGPFNLTTNAAGQVSATFSSQTAGTVSGHAASTLLIGGVPVHVETDGVPPNSSDAVKTFVDANIQITPQVATNPVGSNHTLTGHVNVNAGSGFVNAPDGTVISFSLLNASGATATFVGANSCATAGGTGSCTVIINSPTTGTTTTKAMATLSVGGVSMHRETGDGLPGDSPDANKAWADDVVTTHVRDAANNDITNGTVPAGTVVHDEAAVSKAAGTPATVPDPTGTVDFTLYDNGTCNGNVLATDPGKPLSGGTATSATFTTPAAGGTFSYLAHYNGDANYPAHPGPCESFEVLANEPPTATVVNGQCSSTTLASGTIDLTLFDPDGDPLTLTFASNSNPVLVPNANIVLGGSGNNRSLTVAAAPRQSGTATITLVLSDGLTTVPVVVTVIVGTDRNETLNGTAGTDMIFGLAGKNTLNGNAGDDLLCGGNSNDTLNGGDGNDILDGQNGSDHLDGGAGNDILRGQLGSDTLTGGSGADFFSGGPGNDVATDFTIADGDTSDGTIP